MSTRDHREVRLTIEELAAFLTAGALAFIKEGQRSAGVECDDVLRQIGARLDLRRPFAERSFADYVRSFREHNAAAETWQHYVAAAFADRIAIAEAMRALDDATAAVARVASEALADVEEIPKSKLSPGGYMVPEDDVDELRTALRAWSAASDRFLELVKVRPDESVERANAEASP